MNRLRLFAASAAVVGATSVGALTGLTMLGTASAQTSTPSPSSSSATATAPAADGSSTAPSGPHQANGKTETALTGDDLAKVTAAVQAAVPGATIDRAETDADGATYEAHITRADGTRATVELDATFAVTGVQEGGQGGHGGKGGGGPHQANGITETPLTGDDLAKATAAAQAAVPGATVDRAETDAEGAAYEAHVTKADGTEATVKFDANFTVTSVVDGRG